MRDRFCFQEVVCTLNPGAAEASDADPGAQVPHITSAYLLAVGTTLGLRGVAAAGADANAPDLEAGMAERVTAAIRETFATSEVVKALVADINQQVSFN